MIELYFSYLQRGTTEILKYLRSRIQTGKKIIFVYVEVKSFSTHHKLNLHIVIACVVAYTNCHVCSEKPLSEI